MCKILCINKSPGSDFVEKYIKEKDTAATLVFKRKLEAEEILEEKPDLVLLTEPEIDSLLQKPLPKNVEAEHRFVSFSFLRKEDLHYRLSSYQIGAQECLSPAMPQLELEYKVAIQLNRSKLMRAIPPSIEVKNLTIFPAYRRVLINNEEIRLANKEYEILLLLVKERDRFVTTEEIVNTTWKGTAVSAGNIYTQIHNLKKKIKTFAGEVTSIYGVGFKLELQKFKS